MEIFAIEQQLCPCYRKSQEFQKLVELKDTGLEIYCHRTRTFTENVTQGEAAENAVNTSQYVFILHNKKDVKITTSQLTSELEKKNISCPRCRKIFEHAQELIQEVKSIDSKFVMGICDHCRKRLLGSKKPFCACDKVVKLFKSVKGEKAQVTKKYIRVLPSKMGYVGNDKQKQEGFRVYSDVQINRDLNPPKAVREPEIQQMFFPDAYFESDDTEMVESDSQEGYLKQAVTFSQPVKPMKTSVFHTPGISIVDSDTDFGEKNVGVNELPRPSIKYHGQKQIFEDRPSMDAREELKRRHDLSLRQMIGLKDSGVPLSVSKRPSVYETPKIAPWDRQETTPKYHVKSESDIKIIAPTIKLGHSKIEQRVAKSKSEPFVSAGKEPRFSFLFPHVKEKTENLTNLNLSSTLLIKDTLVSIGVKSENLKKKKEEERQQKLEQERRKKIAREEKLRTVEKKRQAEENEKNIVVEQQSLTEGDKSRKNILGKDGKSDVTKKDMKSKPQQRGKDGLSEKAEKAKNKNKIIEAREVKLRAEEKKRRAEENEKKISGEQQRLTEGDKTRKFILGKDGKSDVTKKDTKAKPQQRGKDGVSEKAEKAKNKNKIIEDKFKPAEKDKGEKKDESLEEEEENIEKFKKDEQAKILRDKSLQEGKEKSVRVASSKTGKHIKMKQNTFDDIKMTTSNIDNLSNKENLKSKKRGTIPKKSTEKSKDSVGEDFKKLQAEYLKEKILKKQQQELEAKKAQQEAERKANIMKLKMNKKIQTSSQRLKQAWKKSPFDVEPELLKAHKCIHDKSGQRSSVCQLCWDSEFELDVLSLDNKKNIKKDKIKDKIIIGERVYTQKSTLEKNIKPEDELPIIVFQKDLYEESDQSIKLEQQVPIIEQETKSVKKGIKKGLSKKDEKELEMGSGKGIIRYALSDRTYINKGWTMLPSEKIVRKMNVYRMRPAHPEFDWFEHNKKKRLMTYDTGERLAEFDDNGRGRWYYRSGQLALDYYDAEETNAHQRFVVYSSGEPDERGRTHPITILAAFDYLGNGVVYDHAGKIRLKYNQTEGVVLDRAIGPVSHWQWHSLNDPPVLQQVMIDTQMAIKDPDILRLGSPADKITQTVQPDNEEMLAIEFDNFVKEKSKKLSQKFKPFQIKMKALKINKYFSLKVLEQSTVYLIFRDGLTNIKVNIGMILDHNEIVDTDTSELGKVSNSLERYPARTHSLESLQRRVDYAQRFERQYIERQRRLQPSEPCASADLLTAATSPPLRLPLITVPTGSSSTTGYCSKKVTNNLYCNIHHPC